MGGGGGVTTPCPEKAKFHLTTLLPTPSIISLAVLLLPPPPAPYKLKINKNMDIVLFDTTQILGLFDFSNCTKI